MLKMRKEFVHTMCWLLQKGVEILYFDESSINISERKTTVWQPKKEPIWFTMPAQNFESFTMLGALSSRSYDFAFNLQSGTNTSTVVSFVEGL